MDSQLAKEPRAARNNGADHDSLDALGREFSRFEAGVSAQADEVVANWQRELDELGGDGGHAVNGHAPWSTAGRDDSAARGRAMAHSGWS